MLQRPQGLFCAQAKASRLESLFASTACALEEGRLNDAVRLADSTCRLAPENPTCRLLHARLLLRLGATCKALEQLRGREEPEAKVARGEALFLEGSFDEASTSVESLLRQYAVNCVEGLQSLAGRLCRSASNSCGWIGVNESLRVAGEVRNAIPLAITLAGRTYHPAISPPDRHGFASFEFSPNPGVPGHISALRGDAELLGSGFKWPPDFGLFGWVTVENRRLLGKVRLEWAPALPITLAISSRDIEKMRVTVPPAGLDFTGAAISVSLLDFSSDASHIEVSAVLPDGRLSPLSGSPVRAHAISPVPVGERPNRTASIDKPNGIRPKIVDIVVPVYTGAAETLLCLESVLATTARTEAEVVVVNDASPDPDLCGALDRLVLENRITLLTNSSNLGFPGAANRGINLHPERDVVLLNSDAEVFGDWLDRLKCAAYCSDDIGTVTPLGETASIMSYPGNADPEHARITSADLHSIARHVNAGQFVDLPVGVGFCLYMKRACLDEVGEFDENIFGKGYGEENDFCLRARRCGWRHLGATDLFVGHRGGRSYGRSKEMLIERNRRVLEILHPGYESLIARFIAADPLRNAKRAIDTHRLLKEAIAPVLLVTSGLRGGVSRHVEQRRAELSALGRTVLILQPSDSGGRTNQVGLSTREAGFENLAYNVPEEAEILQNLLSDLRLTHIELHHFVGLPAAVLDLITRLGVRYDVYVHDYSWVCPRITLLGGKKVYCGEPPVEDCETCVRTHGSALQESLTVAALRERSARILAEANEVIVPTRDVRNRLDRYFPGVRFRVSGWEQPIGPRPRKAAKRDKRIRIAVIGAISIQKGYQVLLECARDAAERDLDLDFVVIGFTADDESLVATGRVFITGPYADSEMAGLLEREQCHVALFPSVTPETWCYALTHAMNWGLPIVSFELGAIAERLHGYSASQLLPLSTEAAGINDTLRRLSQQVSIQDINKELSMSDTSPASASQPIEASAKVLTLSPGVYAFSVQGGPPVISSEELTLPALQLGLAPMRSPGTVEFLAGAGTLDRWLTRSSDSFIVRISGGIVALLLTSLRWPSSSPLTINVQRIDAEAPPDASAVSQPAASGAGATVPAQIMAHIENFGDIYFNDGHAGFAGQKLRIEAFAILSVGQLQPDSIEYCGLMADGYQTPWLSNQILCGSRGRGIGLMGFAVRLRPEISDHYDCTYTGKFLSGTRIGPLKDGQLCSSNLPGDALESIDLQVVHRSVSQADTSSQEIEYSDVT